MLEENDVRAVTGFTINHQPEEVERRMRKFGAKRLVFRAV